LRLGIADKNASYQSKHGDNRSRRKPLAALLRCFVRRYAVRHIEEYFSHSVAFVPWLAILPSHGNPHRSHSPLLRRLGREIQHDSLNKTITMNADIQLKDV
jgi:hypothetical protein